MSDGLSSAVFGDVVRNHRVLTVLAVASWLGVFAVPSAQANDLSGSDDPALLAAIETWLQDNDAESLPLIATLARAGNVAARLLLARIEETEREPTEFVKGLSRQEKVDLFRSDSGKGVFRPNWLKAEKQAGNAFASALLDSSSLDVNLDAIRTLYAIGEPEAAYVLIRKVAAKGSPDERGELIAFLPEGSELTPYIEALHSDLNPGQAALQQIVAGSDLTGSESDTRNAATFVEFGYQNGVLAVDFDLTNSYYDDIVDWIELAPATAPIATLCQQYCNSEEVPSCAVTAFGLVGGYYKAVRFDSPMETLIDQARYTTSDRAVGMVLRRISFAIDQDGDPLVSNRDFREMTVCLAKAVAEVRALRN